MAKIFSKSSELYKLIHPKNSTEFKNKKHENYSKTLHNALNK